MVNIKMNKNKICIYIISWIICLIILTAIFITNSEPGMEQANKLGLFFMSGVFIDFVLLFMLIKNERKMRINTKVKKTEQMLYYREPPFNYSPVIITYLHNLKMEFEKDIIAEIAFLINKKILKLEKINNEYYIDFNIKKGKVMKSQAAILQYIPGKVKLEDFIKELRNHKSYIEKCYEKDCIDLGYVEKGKVVERFNEEILNNIIIVLLIPMIVILINI